MLFTILLMFGQLTWAETHYDQLANEPLLTGFEFESGINMIKVSGVFELCNIPKVTLDGESITPNCTNDASEESELLLCTIPIPYPNIGIVTLSKTLTKYFRKSLLFKIYVDNENIIISGEGRLVRVDDNVDILPVIKDNSSRWMRKARVSLVGPTIHIEINLVAHELTHIVQQRSGDIHQPIILGMAWNNESTCTDM